MLKVSNRDGLRFGDQKTFKSKLLLSRGMAQDVKIFEFEVFVSKNIEFEGFNILGPCVKLIGC